MVAVGLHHSLHHSRVAVCCRSPAEASRRHQCSRRCACSLQPLACRDAAAAGRADWRCWQRGWRDPSATPRPPPPYRPFISPLALAHVALRNALPKLLVAGCAWAACVAAGEQLLAPHIASHGLFASCLSAQSCAWAGGQLGMNFCPAVSSSASGQLLRCSSFGGWELMLLACVAGC